MLRNDAHDLILSLKMWGLLFNQFPFLHKLLFCFSHCIFSPTVTLALNALHFVANRIPNFVQLIIHFLNLGLVCDERSNKPFISFFKLKTDFLFESKRCLELKNLVFFLKDVVYFLPYISLLVFDSCDYFLVSLNFFVAVRFFHFQS